VHMYVRGGGGRVRWFAGHMFGGGGEGEGGRGFFDV